VAALEARKAQLDLQKSAQRRALDDLELDVANLKEAVERNEEEVAQLDAEMAKLVEEVRTRTRERRCGAHVHDWAARPPRMAPGSDATGSIFSIAAVLPPLDSSASDCRVVILRTCITETYKTQLALFGIQNIGSPFGSYT
jgi:uncharacterized coiled-coil protein SlyX